MMAVRLGAIAVTAMASVGFASLVEARPCDAATTAELRAIKLDQWPAYYRTQDTKGLGSFLADDFLSIDAQGRASTRQDELNWLAANPWRPSEFLYVIDAIMCPTSDLAIITGQGQSVRTQNGVRTRHSYISSNLFIRKEDRWQALLSHISGERSEPAG